MKILFVGDYSSLHATMAAELNRQGHTAHVLSDRGIYLGSHADFTLSRQPGIIGSVSYLARTLYLLPRLKGYDVVQLINPGFLSLRPAKLKFIFKTLKRNNGSVFMSLAGDDHFFIKKSVEGLFRFSEMNIGSTPTPFAQSHPEKIKEWLDSELADYTQYIYQNIDGGIAVLPEYHIAAEELLGERLTYIPLHVNVSELKYKKPDLSGPVKIMVGIRRGDNRELQKGSLILAETAVKLEKEFPGKCKAVIVQNQPLSTYLRLLSESHIVLDQLYAYSPATNALQSMALGKLAGTGAQTEYFDFIGERDNGGILSLSPLDDSWQNTLREYILHPERLIEASAEARRLIETHHDVRSSSIRYLDFWQSSLNPRL